MNIQRLSDKQRKRVAALGKRKGREAAGQLLIEGARSVEAAVKGGAQLDMLLVREQLLDDQLLIEKEAWALTGKAGTLVLSMTERQEKSISTVDTSPGFMAVASYKQDSLEDIFAATSVIVLDGVQDPGNVGTIIRTAAWFGIDSVLSSSSSVDIYNPKTVRATMGGLWDVCCVRVDNLIFPLEELKRNRFTLYGTFLKGESLVSWQPGPKTGLVIGSEARGISEPVGAMVDERLSIRRHGKGSGTESLNAATAASIGMYQWAVSLAQ